MAEGTGTSPVQTSTTPNNSAPVSAETEASMGELVQRLTEQSTRLVHSELELAKAEIAAKGKHAGVGAGLFGGAGLITLYGLGALITAGILALALVVPAWASALIVAVVLFVIAGIGALIGKKQVSQATPAAPEKTIDSVKRDVGTMKGGGSS
ncbi:putative membrane protein YqjE [Nocardioides albertanoniae]|uniref:Putative membrane protein YqjE n=1 Tax=Nocardioides albertanoniae TaxID=1175486 RepID=A0A543A925_9ACTN|nr:phage holin family protein [Nocardioides albertanoniae]TQL68976.1 putative membrane protein YqjE [Nocardioides albertanoniae]